MRAAPVSQLASSQHLNYTHLSECVCQSVCAFADQRVRAVMRLCDLIMLHACTTYLEYASSASWCVLVCRLSNCGCLSECE